MTDTTLADLAIPCANCPTWAERFRPHVRRGSVDRSSTQLAVGERRLFSLRERRGGRALAVVFAFDALGADLPSLACYEVPADDEASLAAYLESVVPRPIVEPEVRDPNPSRNQKVMEQMDGSQGERGTRLRVHGIDGHAVALPIGEFSSLPAAPCSFS
jgi:hypothetical protein